MASGCHIEECSSFLLLGTDVAEGRHFHVTSGSLAVPSLSGKLEASSTQSTSSTQSRFSSLSQTVYSSLDLLSQVPNSRGACEQEFSLIGLFPLVRGLDFLILFGEIEFGSLSFQPVPAAWYTSTDTEPSI